MTDFLKLLGAGVVVLVGIAALLSLAWVVGSLLLGIEIGGRWPPW